MPHTRETFTAVLLENSDKRSNTMRGKEDSPLSVKKGLFALSGPELAERTQNNMTALAWDVWNDRERRPTLPEFKQMLDGWYDLAHANLQKTPTNEQMHPVNHRYRTWEVHYSDQSPAVSELDAWMDVFCGEMLARLAAARPYNKDQAAGLLAWADYQMDWVGHVWRDGCGRLSTVLVYWLVLRMPGTSLPVLGSREEHYGKKKTLEQHVEYFRHCLSRS